MHKRKGTPSMNNIEIKIISVPSAFSVVKEMENL